LDVCLRKSHFELKCRDEEENVLESRPRRLDESESVLLKEIYDEEECEGE
jgi:hypothetical protein